MADKIGICVVALPLPPYGDALLERMLHQIRTTTSLPYQVHLITPQDMPALSERLVETGVVVLPSPVERINGPRREHVHLLDRLIEAAVGNGCNLIATFDMDSWPVQSGWDKYYGALLSPQFPVIAVTRSELGDNFPHPCFTLLRSDFWRPGWSSVGIASIGGVSAEGAALSSRPQEPGSGILAQLFDEGRGFLRLSRTNVVELHPLIAGLYDDMIFHLGAASRDPIFITDGAQYGLDGTRLKRRHATVLNTATQQFVISQIRRRHDAFIRTLAGNAPLQRFVPTPTDPRFMPRSLTVTPRAARRIVDVGNRCLPDTFP